MSEAEKKIEEWIEDGPHGNPDADDSSGIWMVKKLTEAAEFGYQLAKEEMEKQVRMTPIVDVRSDTDPNQDELWEELDRECIRLSYTGEVFFLTEEAKKRYQITKKRQ